MQKDIKAVTDEIEREGEELIQSTLTRVAKGQQLEDHAFKR